eukprot:CAMPEP_0206135492 /NCGR_PEP_ID=MMETSP1473-20131121/767_1 /ASSEMBLY_ACC=CAM_ASM_001109 /TAXON_ID=1461547 /ORGANISM="Stichococcus sp, Strain RCC1054" /LENGTH=32 /DNA_ID= /DNA_START= /DNA_END= /DNA_ORIENTATION=
MSRRSVKNELMGLHDGAAQRPQSRFMQAISGG